ncbi:hypothetical protein, partial [Proteus terrae]|uniref:phage tail tip fiber protein n=1 Tax=Proteus terrae TaxID=1574161 RepID=UPI0018C6E635
VISSLNGKVVTPFVIQNGQAFFNDALFSKATIDKLSVGKKITSTNYLAGKKGFNIDAITGNVELNDAVFRGRLDINSGGTKGRLVITNNTIYVYDENNQLAAKIGYLG